MRLSALDAQFIRREIRPCYVGAPECNTISPHTEHEYYIPAPIVEADGIMFLCPKCFATNGGGAGTHSVVCWFEGKVADDVEPGPGRWNPTGTGIDDLSFVPGAKSNSVQLLGNDNSCKWHGFITNGDAT